MSCINRLSNKLWHGGRRQNRLTHRGGECRLLRDVHDVNDDSNARVVASTPTTLFRDNNIATLICTESLSTARRRAYMVSRV